MEISYSDVHAQLLSCVRLFVTPWTVACQAPLSMRFSRQEYWNGLPLPSPRDLINSGIKAASPAVAGGFFISVPPECYFQYNRMCYNTARHLRCSFLFKPLPEPDILVNTGT